MSQPKPSVFQILEAGTLAPFVEIPVHSYEILAPFGPTLAKNGMRESEALSSRLRFSDPYVVFDPLHHAYHCATMSCIHRNYLFSVISPFMLTRPAHS